MPKIRAASVLFPFSGREDFRHVFSFNFGERLRLLSSPLHAHGNANRFRQIVHLYALAGRNNHRPLDSVGKLAHVAGKLIFAQQRERIGRNLASP